jgi:hypothetical protein
MTMSLSKKILIILAVQLVTLFCSDISAKTVSREVAYLQTDRTTYIAGESIYYKLYVLDSESRKRSEISKVGYVLVRSANSQSSLKIRVKIESGIASGSILLPDTLTSGVYQLVAFTSTMRNSGEQNFFYQKIVIANRFDKELKFKLVNPNATDSNIAKFRGIDPVIKTDKKVYGLREKVIVSLENMASKSNVAVSVYEEPQVVSSAKTIVETMNAISAVPENSQVLMYHSPENKGKILRGKVIDVATKKCVSESVVLLSCNDTVPNLQYAVTNANGGFQMLLNDYYDGKELFLTIKDVPAGQQLKIETEDEFAQNQSWNPSLIPGNIDFKEFIVKSQNIVYINKSYQLTNDVADKPASVIDPFCPMFYHCTGTTILPSDFVSLDDFPEIVIEILPQVLITRDKGKPRVKVYNSLIKMFNNSSPAIFLDGVFVDDVNKILGLGSEQINKIEVFEVEREFGDLPFSGVLSIQTKSNEIMNTMPALHSLRLKNDKVNAGGRLVAVHPDQIQVKVLPLFKQLLYWNPNLELNGNSTTNVEFYTSDYAANYIIKMEGVSDNGTLISSSSSMQVNNQPNVTEK